jgi:hypothetical protein
VKPDREAYVRRASTLVRKLSHCIELLNRPDAEVRYITAWIDKLDARPPRAVDADRWTLLIDFVRFADQLVIAQRGLSDLDAAQRSLEILSSVDGGELASKLRAADVAEILPAWRVRKQNVGGKGRPVHVSADAMIRDLGQRIGLPRVTEDAIRKRRARGTLPP